MSLALINVLKKSGFIVYSNGNRIEGRSTQPTGYLDRIKLSTALCLAQKHCGALTEVKMSSLNHGTPSGPVFDISVTIITDQASDESLAFQLRHGKFPGLNVHQRLLVEQLADAVNVQCCELRAAQL